MNKYYLKIFQKKALDFGIDIVTVISDEVQSLFLQEFFKNPCSNGAVLFGGGRFRHINNSIRFSVDLDFFRTKEIDLTKVIAFVSNKFIPFLKKHLGISARIIESPPWEESHNVKTIRILLFDDEEDFYQIEIDLDFIDRYPYHEYKNGLVNNVIVSIGDDSEILEEKLISIFEREPFKSRDIFDLWYYRNLSTELNIKNIQEKIRERCITKDRVKKILKDMEQNKGYYISEIRKIIQSCGEKREEVVNILKLDLRQILDFVKDAAERYILSGEI